MAGQPQGAAVERWGVYDLPLRGPSAGNPFVDVTLSADFSYRNRVVRADGFYDGDGVYRIRCMPDAVGEWHCVTHSNCPELDGVIGGFNCTAPAAGNHGPVGVRNTYHFAYADGAPFWQIGTTCYAWTHQGDALEEQTLATLAGAPFNKLRMCVFPKHYVYNENEPVLYPFERAGGGGWDTTRFSPAYFRHQEQRVAQLRDLGIEADLILFHPYDRWGFATMDAAGDGRYLRYLVARLAAYRNVWWSLANEYDLMKEKTVADWDRFFRIIQECDPYQHPRSIHNCREFYDHNKPWVTHQSIQRSDVEQTRTWRTLCKKPVVVDECRYEGDIQNVWGCLTAEEMARRFWETAVRGGYCGHGETYLHQHDILWWSKGGALHGQSVDRIAFFRTILEKGPADGHEPLDGVLGSSWSCAGKAGEYYLAYFGAQQPRQAVLTLPEEGSFCGEILDTWRMTATAIPGLMRGRTIINLPARPYCGLRVWRT